LSLFPYLFCFSILILLGSLVTKAQNKIIDIVDCRGKEYPKPDYKTHKFKDLEIYRFGGIQGAPNFTGGFDLLIWGKENDSLQRYGRIVVFSDDNFTKASYNWDVDTMLLIRFFNPNHKEDLNLRYSGNILDIKGKIGAIFFGTEETRNGKGPLSYVGILDQPKKR